MNNNAKELAKDFIASLEKSFNSCTCHSKFRDYVQELTYTPKAETFYLVHHGTGVYSGYEFTMFGEQGEKIVLSSRSTTFDYAPAFLTVNYNGEKWEEELGNDMSSVLWEIFYDEFDFAQYGGD